MPHDAIVTDDPMTILYAKPTRAMAAWQNRSHDDGLTFAACDPAASLDQGEPTISRGHNQREASVGSGGSILGDDRSA